MAKASPATTEATPPSSRRARWRRWCARLALLAGVCVVAGATYERLSLHRAAAEFPAPGTRVDIGGRALHLKVEGQGGPTVLFESGAGSTSMTWEHVVPPIAERARVVTYDRAGYGWSDPAAGRGAVGVVEDLEAALRVAKIEGPYVLVGHSIGGLYLRLFAYRNRQQVAGMVLVDSSHEDQFVEASDAVQARFDRMGWLLELAVPTAHVGIPRLLAQSQPLGPTTMSTTARRVSQAKLPSHTHLVALRNEFRSFDHVGPQVRAQQVPLGDLPLHVLTADEPAFADEAMRAFRKRWLRYQRELAARSTWGQQQVVPGSGHNIQQDKPQAVVDAILQVLEQIRQVER